MLVSTDIHVGRRSDEDISGFFSRITDEVMNVVSKRAGIRGREIKKLSSKYDRDKKELVLEYLVDKKDRYVIQASVRWETRKVFVFEGDCKCGARIYQRSERGDERVVCDKCGLPVKTRMRKDVEQKVVIEKIVVERGVWLQCKSCGHYWLYSGFKRKTQCPRCGKVVNVLTDMRPVPLLHLLEAMIAGGGRIEVEKKGGNKKVSAVIRGKGITLSFEADTSEQLLESISDFENYVSSMRTKRL